jgi:hypothetical protein
MNLNRFCSVVFLVLLVSTLSNAQQRPLLTEDPRLIAEGTLVTELGFGYQHQARFPISIDRRLVFDSRKWPPLWWASAPSFR